MKNAQWTLGQHKEILGLETCLWFTSVYVKLYGSSWQIPAN